jgi:hypothetical protein
MSAITDADQLHDTRELPVRLAQSVLHTSDGRPASDGKADGSKANWVVVLSTDGHQVRRDVWIERDPWDAVREGWEPEGVIWPTWPARAADQVSESALGGTQQYWLETGNRLRDSAKWIATVLGAGLAALVGTSPLASMRQHHFGAASVILGLVGLSFISATLFLVIQVMRPQAVSYLSIQSADPERRWFRSALGRWRQTVESHEDLYLPCGVNSLTSLRQSMIIENVTLLALAAARECPEGRKMRQQLEEAQVARSLWLAELRNAAAQVVSVGEYYMLRSRSTRATYGGILCGLIGSAAIIAAFIWPVT